MKTISNCNKNIYYCNAVLQVTVDDVKSVLSSLKEDLRQPLQSRLAFGRVLGKKYNHCLQFYITDRQTDSRHTVVTAYLSCTLSSYNQQLCSDH